MDVLTLRDTIVTALAGVNADVTPDEPLVDASGRVKRTVIIDVTPGTVTGRRASGRGDRLDGAVNALIVAPTRDSCLALAQQVRDRLADLPLGHPHGRLTDQSYDGAPLPEPGDARWSTTLTFATITKRSS